jgi:hypothetical protein
VPRRRSATAKGRDPAFPPTWVTCTDDVQGGAERRGRARTADLYSKDGTQAKLASTVASRVYELPDACLVGVYALKVIKSTKQTTTAGAAAGANAIALVLRD